MDPRLVNDIKQAERCELTAYKDTNGYWTIGWGHKFPDQSTDWTGTTWTQDQADQQLATDIAAAQKQAEGLPEWQALDTDCRDNAVTELVYNMGLGKWLKFTHTRQAIDQRQWQEAHDQLLDSAWANQVHATRADRLADYLRTGEYP